MIFVAAVPHTCLLFPPSRCRFLSAWFSVHAVFRDGVLVPQRPFSFADLRQPLAVGKSDRLIIGFRKVAR